MFALNSLLALLVPLTLLVESVSCQQDVMIFFPLGNKTRRAIQDCWMSSQVPVQLFQILAMVTWFAIFMNIGSKYAVAYAPPDLFGTFLGFLVHIVVLYINISCSLFQLLNGFASIHPLKKSG